LSAHYGLRPHLSARFGFASLSASRLGVER
jgi:hypothetical protein